MHTTLQTFSYISKKSLLRILAARIHSVREKIRTPGLLIRSQTLYPAELRAQIISCTSHLCSVLEILYISFSKNASFFFIFFILIYKKMIKPALMRHFQGSKLLQWNKGSACHSSFLIRKAAKDSFHRSRLSFPETQKQGSQALSLC